MVPTKQLCREGKTMEASGKDPWLPGIQAEIFMNMYSAGCLRAVKPTLCDGIHIPKRKRQ